MFSRDSLTADLLLEPPRAYTVSLYSWLSSAAVVAEIGNAGTIVRSRANRVFRLEDVTTLVREWMRAYEIDSVFATCAGTLFSITCPLSQDALRHL